jgi:hypothetical protein
LVAPTTPLIPVEVMLNIPQASAAMERPVIGAIVNV